jgi:hypothetical protein
MNTLPIHNFPHFALSFFRETIESSVNQQDNKIATIAVLAFACLAAAYLFGCCCFKAQTIIVDEPDEKFDYPDGSQAIGKFAWNSGEREFNGKVSNFRGTKIEEGIFIVHGKDSKPILDKGKRTKNGIIEEGEFIDGELEKGKKTYPDGTILDGNFDWQIKLTKGTRILPNGTKEEGKFERNQLNGKGKVTIPKGDTIEGFFRDGKLDGFGRIIHHDGSIKEGLFKMGELVEERKPNSTTKRTSPKASIVTTPHKPTATE